MAIIYTVIARSPSSYYEPTARSSHDTLDAARAAAMAYARASDDTDQLVDYEIHWTDDDGRHMERA